MEGPLSTGPTPSSLGSLCFDKGTRVVLLFIDFLEERECVERIGSMKNGLVFTFPFLHASNTEKPHLSSPITTKASLITSSAETGTSLDSLAW